MTRYLHFLIVATITTLLLSACGGVASNPTTPNFTPPGQNQPGTGIPGEGTAGDLTGQLSGGSAEMGEELIQGNFETLWPQGIEAMENGETVSAAQFFMSAFAQDSTSADAAFAYAITDIMKCHRKYAVFMHPGVDKLFMNTPIIGHPEVFPNPFLTEDSYMLRLASLGYRAGQLKPAVVYPIIATADTDQMFKPELFQSMAGRNDQTMIVEPGIAGEASTVGPDGNVMTVPGGEETENTDGESETGDGSGETTDGTETPADGGTRPPESEGQRMGLGKLPSGKQVTTDGSSDTGGRDNFEGLTGSYGFDEPVLPQGVLPEREEPFTENEWDTMINDYRNAIGRDGADIFLSPMFYGNLDRLHSDIREHISNLESVRHLAEAEGYTLSLPFNVLDGTEKMTLTFNVNDFHMILDHLKLLDVLLSYVMAYDSTSGFVLPTAPIVDTDDDNVIRPDEYLPAAPFGTLPEGMSEELANQLPEFINTLMTLQNDVQPLFDAAEEVQPGDPEEKELFYLSSFHRNYVLIENWFDLLQNISENSSSSIAIKVIAGSEVLETTAVYDALFGSPVTDIHEVLPSFDAETMVPITDDDGNWSADHTFGGFFPENLTDINTYMTEGRLTLVVYDEEMAKGEGFTVNAGTTGGDADEDGIIILDNVQINELAGTDYSVFNTDGEELEGGTLRTLYEIIPLFDFGAFGPLVGMTPGPATGVGGGPAAGGVMDMSGTAGMGTATGIPGTATGTPGGTTTGGADGTTNGVDGTTDGTGDGSGDAEDREEEESGNDEGSEEEDKQEEDEQAREETGG